jgi:bifunctional UDP-N-acetylglucosamine pyrophosphorylase/glucosamine-1-phosphate N-acetyltransferase
VGPLAHIRPDTVLEDGAEAGAFVETKNARLGKKVCARHLSYLGDIDIGPRTNVGCGTITANYDGRKKYHTEVGADAFIGAGTLLVAPTSVGDGGRTGAGAVVTKAHPVPAGQTYVGVPAKALKGSSKFKVQSSKSKKKPAGGNRKRRAKRRSR